MIKVSKDKVTESKSLKEEVVVNIDTLRKVIIDVLARRTGDERNDTLADRIISQLEVN